MKKRYALLVLALVLSGCTEGTSNSTALEQEASTGLEKTEMDDSQESSSEMTEDEQVVIETSSDSSSTKDASDKDVTGEDSSIENTEEETTAGGNEEQKSGDASSEKSDKQTIQDTASAEEQEKAVSLTEDYLRERNELVEDENNFVRYDGTINDYILVRYSSLVSGHSSTNGRYAVEINKGKVIDVTAAADFDTLLN